MKYLILLFSIFISIICLSLQTSYFDYRDQYIRHDYQLNNFYNNDNSLMEKITVPENAVVGTHLNHYNNFMQSYFDNLTTNMGRNYKGSCGYVAIGMLLSYYDTYLNDNIIPEVYDIVSSGGTNNMVSRRNSPGIMNDIVATNDRSTAGLYLAAMQNISNISLHAKLIMIGNNLGFYNVFDDENPAETNFSMREYVINDYLQNFIGFYSSSYSFNYYKPLFINATSSNNVRNYTIDKIQAGYPVLLSIRNSNNEGHVVVAYDYDEDNDLIYTNMGWNSYTTHVTPESQDFTKYTSALVIDWNISHNHSDNYGVTTNGITSYYCYDSASIEYRHHAEANYTNYQQINGDYSYHYATCTCGWSGLHEHGDFIIGFPNPSVTCGRCYKWIM